jgi:hypothetical protein
VAWRISTLFVSLVYCAESTVRWFVVREKYCWIAADSADKSKRTGRRKPWAARAREAWAPHAPFHWGRRRYVLGHFVGRVSGLVGGSPSFFGGL